jgi:hypothetical protein
MSPALVNLKTWLSRKPLSRLPIQEGLRQRQLLASNRCGFLKVPGQRNPRTKKGRTGTRFKMYVVVLSASPERFNESDVCEIMLRIISINVRLRLSATLFIAGEPNIVYYGTIPLPSKNLAKGPGHCSPEPSERP